MQKLVFIGLMIISFNQLFAQCFVDFDINVDSNNYVNITDTFGGGFQFCTCCIGINYGDPASGLLNTGHVYGLNHFYKYPGTYTICQAPGFCSCPAPADTICKQVTIIDTGSNCQAAYCYTAISDINGNLSVTFVNTSSSDDSITRVYWDYYDGMQSNQYNPQHYFITHTWPQPTALYIETASGCQSVYIDTIQAGINCDGLCDTLDIFLNDGWNMISSNIIPDTPGMEAVFNEINQEIVLVKNNTGQTYIPSLGINDIGNWEIEQGYQVKVSSPVNLTIGCIQVDPLITPIVLNAGWNMIAYLRNSAMDASVAMYSIASNVLLEKNSSGQTYIPLIGVNTIGNMLPGQGYRIKMSTADTLFYPGN